INYIPDFNKIDKFIKFIKKARNFKSLCKNKDDIREFECVIFDFSYKFIKSKKEIIFTISANRFLHSMVRAIIGSALEIGRGKEDLINVIKKIEKGERLGIPYLPGNALFLNKIYY
ncbi:MAG: tRNA pseudouridine(38-40) synthase TruA, partial [Ignavibacteria bacterium]|nr:tRNA pseudouridine(38-40) synthase TruA [Ignavibacteria bacterium]